MVRGKKQDHLYKIALCEAKGGNRINLSYGEDRLQNQPSKDALKQWLSTKVYSKRKFNRMHY